MDNSTPRRDGTEWQRPERSGLADRERSMEPRTDWQRIQEESRAQWQAELAAAEETPLVFGNHIAWVDCLAGRTNGLSEAHRVGFPTGHDPYTTCGELIPNPVRWLSLSPALVRSLGKCRYCEAEHVRAVRDNAA